MPTIAWVHPQPNISNYDEAEWKKSRVSSNSKIAPYPGRRYFGRRGVVWNAGGPSACTAQFPATS